MLPLPFLLFCLFMGLLIMKQCAGDSSESRKCLNLSSCFQMYTASGGGSLLHDREVYITQYRVRLWRNWNDKGLISWKESLQISGNWQIKVGVTRFYLMSGTKLCHFFGPQPLFVRLICAPMAILVLKWVVVKKNSASVLSATYNSYTNAILMLLL